MVEMSEEELSEVFVNGLTALKCPKCKEPLKLDHLEYDGWGYSPHAKDTREFFVIYHFNCSGSP